MDLDNIKDRILEFLKTENKSSAHFAQEIGVQPSAISHIISGRNKPSLDFVMKMINRYPSVSTEWLLFGKGSMYRNQDLVDLFSDGPEPGTNTDDNIVFSDTKNDKIKSDYQTVEDKSTLKTRKEDSVSDKKPLKATRIIVFYEDNTFSEHFPGSE